MQGVCLNDERRRKEEGKKKKNIKRVSSFPRAVLIESSKFLKRRTR